MGLALILLPIMAVIVHLSTQSSVCVTCENKNLGYSVINHTEITCLAKNLIVEAENENLNIVSIHSVGVAAFMADRQSIYYLPTGIAKAFPSLTHLTVKKSKLRKITSKNLEEFKNLTYLDLSWNKIEELEENIFEHNQQLEVVLLNNNHIVQIDSTAFSTVQSLKFLDLQHNECFSIIVYNYSEAMKITASESFQAESKIFQLIITRSKLKQVTNELKELRNESSNHYECADVKVLVGIAILILLVLTNIIIYMSSIKCCNLRKKSPKRVHENREEKQFNNLVNFPQINLTAGDDVGYEEPRTFDEPVYDEVKN